MCGHAGHGNGQNRALSVAGQRDLGHCDILGRCRARDTDRADDAAVDHDRDAAADGEGVRIGQADDPPGLDPFFGSGTTGVVCRELGLDFVGLDISHDYLEKQAKPRALRQMPKGALDGLPLFGGGQ